MHRPHITALGLLALVALSETLGAVRDTDATGIFINGSHVKIQVSVVSKDEKEAGEMVLPPEAIERSVLFAGGRAKLYTPSKDVVSGRLLFTLPLPTPTTAPEFFERSTRRFYFRVIDRKIVLVRPGDLTSKEKEWLRERTRAGW
jgi:hypothetical protein